MIFMFRIFPENFLIRNTSVFLECFVKEAALGFFTVLITVHSAFFFYCFSPFLFCFTGGFIKALTHTLGLQIGCTQVAILIEISQTVQTYTEIPEPIAHLIRTSSY